MCKQEVPDSGALSGSSFNKTASPLSSQTSLTPKKTLRLNKKSKSSKYEKSKHKLKISSHKSKSKEYLDRISSLDEEAPMNDSHNMLS